MIERKRSMKKRNLFLMIILILYSLLVFSHGFFSKSEFHKKLSTKGFIAHFYSFPVLIGIVVSIFSAIVLLIFCFKYGTKFYKNRTAMIWVFMLFVSVVFIVSGTERRKTPMEISYISNENVIKLVEWNVANNIDEKNIYEIFGEFDADIAVFPELEGYEKGDFSNQRLKDLFERANLDFSKYEAYLSLPTEGNIAPVTVVIKKEFGQYDCKQEIPMTQFGTVSLHSKKENIPDIIGLHTAPPLPGLMYFWKIDLDFIAYDLVKNNPNAIIIGDFNATMRHGAMNDIDTHEDILNYAPVMKRGTWNKDIPDLFKTTIDHILVPANQYSVKKVEIRDLENSDHMCIFAEIQKNK